MAHGNCIRLYPLVQYYQHDEDRYLLTLQVSIAASASTWALHGASLPVHRAKKSHELGVDK